MESKEIYSYIKNLIPNEKIFVNEPMSKHTSFKTGGNADIYVKLTDITEIEAVVNYTKENNVPLYIIGNGSNILVLDKGIRGIVLKIELNSIEINKNRKKVQVKVGAGTKIMALAQILKKQQITGFEELSNIPGTIGGANYMNAGAYGKEIKDIIEYTKVLNIENGCIEVLYKEEQELKYRESIFKNKKYIILEIMLNLKNGNFDEIHNKMEEYQKLRKEKQPTEFASAGSTFKRGKNFITAQLIDECGLKGYTIGGAQISPKHAGFIINKGNATSQDIIDLINYTKKKVFEKFGVYIEEEVEIIGEI